MENTSLYHSGIKGMRWGVRRYQNKDGSLTPAGRKRYASPGTSNAKGASQSKPKAVVKGKTSAAGNKPKAVVKNKASTAENKPKELTVEEQKAKVLASRSAKELYENRKLFDYKEMEGAYNLLLKDKQVKDLIVTDPNKVENFFDKTVIPWANRVKNIATPVVDTLKKLDEASKLFGGGENSTPQTTGKKPKSDKTDKADKADKADKPKIDKVDKPDNPKTDKPNSFDLEPTYVKTKSSTPEETSPEPNKSRYQAVRGKYYRGTIKTDNASPDSDDSVSGDWLGKETRTELTVTQPRSEKKTTYYDVDYVDHTPSQQTTSFVASLSGSTVAALPAPSSQALSFVAGLLPAPKED